MANKSVALMIYGKTANGWKHLHVIIGRNGKIKPGVGSSKVGGTDEVAYTQGHFELRTYKGKQVQYESVGTDPSEALAKRKDFHITKAVREGVKAFATQAGLPTPGPDRKDKPQDLRAKGIEFLRNLEARGKDRAAELWTPTFEGFLEATGVTQAHEITQDTVLAYHAALRRRGNEDRTIYNRHVSLFQFFGWLGLDRKKLGVLPGTDTSITPEYTDREVEVYTQQQLGALFEVCRDDYDRVVFNLLLKTGLRMAEAMHLDWMHVDFGEKVLRVREQRKVGKKIKDRAERTVPMPDDLIALLKAWRAKNPTTRLVIGTKTDKPNDKLLRTLKRIVKAGKLNCGVCDGCNGKERECYDWYLHKFRATYTTTLLRAGIDIRTVMSYTGHSDFATVERYLSSIKANVMQPKISSIAWV